MISHERPKRGTPKVGAKPAPPKGFVDRVIERYAPGMALRRERARMGLSLMATFHGGLGGRGFMDTAHEGASHLRRAMQRWTPWTSRNPDDEVLIERPELLARARDAWRNQAVARSAVETPTLSVVGQGLEMHSRIDAKFLGLTPDEADAWQKQAERLFRAWAGSTDADMRRRNSFYRLQSHAFRAYRRDGEIFALLPLVPRKGTVCNLRVQLIEGDRISTPFWMINGPLADQKNASFFGTPQNPVPGSLWDGIETGRNGEPVAYHVETTVPIPYVEIVRTWKRVLAFGARTGRRQVIHFYDEDRPGQRRGITSLSPILEQLKQLKRYCDAELSAAELSALFTVFVIHADADVDPVAGIARDHPLAGTPREQPPGPDRLEGGAGIIDLNDGEDVKFADPGRPNQEFGPFVTEILKQVGMGTNIPYELLVKQFTVSYSASRAAILLAWAYFLVLRGWFTQEFCQPIYEEFLANAVTTGMIEAPGFNDDEMVRRAYCGTRWYGPTMPALDPKKDADAAKTRMDIGISTLATATEEYDGSDWEENLRQIGREKALMDELGITPVQAVAPTAEPVIDPEEGMPPVG